MFRYAARFFLCELLALGNVVGQMFMLDKFFDGEFMNYGKLDVQTTMVTIFDLCPLVSQGFEVLEFLDRDDEDRVDPMIRIFPRVTKCKFYMVSSNAVKVQ